MALRGVSFALAGAALWAGAVVAHPHAASDQQVRLRLGLEGVELTVFVAPGTDVADDMTLWLDADGSGDVSAAEAVAAADEIVAGAILTLDGQEIPFMGARLTVPDLTRLAASDAILVASAEATWILTPGPHDVAFKMDWSRFQEGWQIQPFYGAELISAAKTPTLMRAPGDDGITVVFTVP